MRFVTAAYTSLYERLTSSRIFLLCELNIEAPEYYSLKFVFIPLECPTYNIWIVKRVYNCVIGKLYN